MIIIAAVCIIWAVISVFTDNHSDSEESSSDSAEKILAAMALWEMMHDGKDDE